MTRKRLESIAAVLLAALILGALLMWADGYAAGELSERATHWRPQ